MYEMDVTRVTTEDLARLLADTTDAAPLIVDVRLKYPYEHSTITLPGAIRLLPDALLTALPCDRDIVLYDSDPDELVAERVALRLLREGRRVRVLKGGIAAWAAARLPTTPKSAPQLAAPMAAPGRA